MPLPRGQNTIGPAVSTLGSRVRVWRFEFRQLCLGKLNQGAAHPRPHFRDQIREGERDDTLTRQIKPHVLMTDEMVDRNLNPGLVADF